VVLSALGLLALVAATFAQIARTHVKTAAAAGESAKAEALADAGVQLAILDLVAAREAQAPNRRFPLDATPLACSIGAEGATLTIAVQDEAGKVDLNIGSESLLRALVLGIDVQAGEAVVDAMLDFRDGDDDRRPAGAERAEYRAAGRSHGPKNAPFVAVEELAGVLGLTQVDLERLRPFVTIYSGQPAIDVAVAPAALIEVLQRGIDRGGMTSPAGGQPFGGKQAGRGAPLPAEFLAASTRRAFSIHSQARTPAGAIFVREAIVEFTSTRAEAFIVRRWYRGAAAKGGAGPPSQGLSPC
jgi:general secretion pathway protein K